MLPWRGDAHAADRPRTLPLPPGPMPLWRAGRPRKRWRYVAAFSDELMLCVALAKAGPVPQGWWAVWDRRRGTLWERTVFARPGRVVSFGDGTVTVRDGDLAIDLVLDEAGGVESVCADGTGYVWTRKQAAIAVRGTVRIAGVEQPVDGLAVVDDTAGYHAHHTAWRWAAGVGRTEAGAVVGWNLVDGINDPHEGSERSVWVDGVATEVAPVTFAPALGGVAFAEGGALRFSAEAVRERHDELVLMRSDYVQPFGTVSGTLPGAGRLTEGFGVMEDHVARW